MTPEMRKPPPDNAKGALNRRRLSSVNGGLVDRIGETPTRAAIRFNRMITGDASPVIQASKKPPPRNANNAAAASIIVWWLGGIAALNCPQILSAPFYSAQPKHRCLRFNPSPH